MLGPQSLTSQDILIHKTNYNVNVHKQFKSKTKYYSRDEIKTECEQFLGRQESTKLKIFSLLSKNNL